MNGSIEVEILRRQLEYKLKFKVEIWNGNINLEVIIIHMEFHLEDLINFPRILE